MNTNFVKLDVANTYQPFYEQDFPEDNISLLRFGCFKSNYRKMGIDLITDDINSCNFSNAIIPDKLSNFSKHLEIDNMLDYIICVDGVTLVLLTSDRLFICNECYEILHTIKSKMMQKHANYRRGAAISLRNDNYVV